MARGDLHRIGFAGVGHEQRGVRLCVVVQSEALLLSTVVVAPTSTRALRAEFRAPIIVDGVATQVLLEQVKAVDVSLLRAPVGAVSREELDGIDEALRLVMGLW